MGEEWRRGWHPERVNPARRRERVLVVGAGPAGLEAALTLGRRGHEVTLADRNREPGGRLLNEARLPGLQTWIRVRDWRVQMIGKLANVQLFPASVMAAADVADFGADHVVLATGARWRRDGVGVYGIERRRFAEALTPDDIFAGAAVTGPVVIYDDEHYFMGGALAERLATDGLEVTLVTPEARASAWTVLTNEHEFVQARLIETGVRLALSQYLTASGGGRARLACAFTGRESEIACETLVLVTGRVPDHGLCRELEALGIAAARTGDCLQPSSVADAVYSGHRLARYFGEAGAEAPPRRERPPIRETDHG
jgi:dimethylamine/trimethylamine dehydrogenase